MVTAPGAGSTVGPIGGFNAADYLVGRHVAGGDGGRTAVLASETLTYGELDERVTTVASGLRSLGLRRDDRVMMVMSDEIPMLTGILGSFRAGLVAVPVSTMLTGSELATIMADSGARVVLATPEFAGTVGQAVAACPEIGVAPPGICRTRAISAPILSSRAENSALTPGSAGPAPWRSSTPAIRPISRWVSLRCLAMELMRSWRSMPCRNSARLLPRARSPQT